MLLAVRTFNAAALAWETAAQDEVVVKLCRRAGTTGDGGGGGDAGGISGRSDGDGKSQKTVHQEWVNWLFNSFLY